VVYVIVPIVAKSLKKSRAPAVEPRATQTPRSPLIPPQTPSGGDCFRAGRKKESRPDQKIIKSCERPRRFGTGRLAARGHKVGARGEGADLLSLGPRLFCRSV